MLNVRFLRHIPQSFVALPASSIDAFLSRTRTTVVYNILLDCLRTAIDKKRALMIFNGTQTGDF